MINAVNARVGVRYPRLRIRDAVPRVNARLGASFLRPTHVELKRVTTPYRAHAEGLISETSSPVTVNARAEVRICDVWESDLA